MIFIINRLKLDSSLRKKMDYNFAIVRDIQKEYLDPGEKQLSVLSPSNELFQWCCNMQASGNWNEDSFQQYFLPQFLQEMNSKEARHALNQIVKLDRAGKIVVLNSFFKDESLCHRSILGGMLQGVGCNVVMESGKDYSNYYRLFEQLAKVRQVFGAEVPITIQN